jgi:acylglycerol lipase
MSSSPYKEVWLPGPQSTQFYTRTYACPSSPKAIIVFVHGFAEHVGRYTHIHPLFAANGITVFTFDQRGFGRTAQDEKEKSKGSAYGKTSWADGMRDIDWAVGHVKKEWPEVPVFLMGHSMVRTSSILSTDKDIKGRGCRVVV